MFAQLSTTLKQMKVALEAAAVRSSVWMSEQPCRDDRFGENPHGILPTGQYST